MRCSTNITTYLGREFRSFVHHGVELALDQSVLPPQISRAGRQLIVVAFQLEKTTTS